MSVRTQLGKSDALRMLHACTVTLKTQFGLNFRWLAGIGPLVGFSRQFRNFRTLNQASPYQLRGRDIIPCLADRTATTPIEPIYLLQDTWFARQIAKQRPAEHVDVGSSVKSMALVAQFVPLVMVDIRPVEIEISGFTFRPGSILALPYNDGSVRSLSSLCVIEHIGLGRYGDALDGAGTEKAAAELKRVLATDGDLYVSVPVDAECRVYFNAHRALTRNHVLQLFAGLELMNEAYIYGRELRPDYEAERGFGTGLYHFRRT